MVSERPLKSNPPETHSPSHALHAYTLGREFPSAENLKRETPVYKRARCFGNEMEIPSENSNLPKKGFTSAKPVLLFLVATLLFSTLPAWSQTSLPEGPGKEIVQTTCAACHTLNTVSNAGHTREDWQTVLHMMVNVGAPVPQAQFDAVTRS